MNIGIVAGAFGLGATLGILPGPVQVVLLTESTRGGSRRGFAAMAGANGTMAILMLALAGGVTLAPPTGLLLRFLKVAGGLFLLYMAAGAIRESFGDRHDSASAVEPSGGRPLLRGSLSVLLNPGAWIFLVTTAAAVFASAQHSGGRPLAVGAAAAMMAGVAVIDGSMVLLGDGVRRFETAVTRGFSPILGGVLAIFGVILLIQGMRG